MTAKVALIKSLLDGKVLNVMNCFTTIGLTNCAREVSRMVEQPFEVRIDRIPRKGVSKCGEPITWNDYKLNKTLPQNVEGVAKMREYLAEHIKEYRPKSKFVQATLFS